MIRPPGAWASGQSKLPDGEARVFLLTLVTRPASDITPSLRPLELADDLCELRERRLLLVQLAPQPLERRPLVLRQLPFRVEVDEPQSVLERDVRLQNRPSSARWARTLSSPEPLHRPAAACQYSAYAKHSGCNEPNDEPWTLPRGEVRAVTVGLDRIVLAECLGYVQY